MLAQRAGAVLALGAVTAAASLGFDRVFKDTDWAVPVFAAAVGGLLLVVLTTRLRALWALALSAAGMLALSMGSTLGHTTFFGLPTTATVTGFGDVLGDERALGKAKPPVATNSGLILLSVLGVWLISALAGWLALRTSRPLAAVVAPLGLHITLAIFDPFGLDGPTTFAVVVTALLYVSVHQSLTLPAAWMTSEGGNGRGRAGAAATSAMVALVVGILAVAVGPSLPGAKANALIDVGQGNESTGGPRETVSPMVDLKQRLVKSPPVQLFTVKSSVPSYWRLTALPTLETEGWASYLDYVAAKGELEPELPEEAETSLVEQRFRIGTMDRFWLPAAYRPTRIELDGSRVDPNTMTLYTRKKSVTGLDYTVESAVPLSALANLGGAGWGDPKFLKKYKTLPLGFPSQIGELSKDLTRDADSPFAAAQALLGWLQDRFVYDLNVPPGHNGPRLERFLFEDKKGYCEQFAAAFAAMARTVGIPSRVAVGWLPGELDGDTGLYTVTTKETHAWVELYLQGNGWVAFDPTPGRNSLNDNQIGPISPTRTDEAGSLDVRRQAPANELGAAPADGGGGSASDEPERGDQESAAGDLGQRVLGWLLILMALAILVLLARASLPPLVKRRRRRARRRAAQTRARVAGAWWEALDRMREAGSSAYQAATPLEFAGDYSERATSHRRDVSESLSTLAGLFTRATWGAEDPTPEEADEAWRHVDRLVAGLNRGASGAARTLRRLDLSTVRRPGEAGLKPAL